MSHVSRQIILFAIDLMKYAMAWDPAPQPPNLQAQVDALAGTLKTSEEALSESQKNAV